MSTKDSPESTTRAVAARVAALLRTQGAPDRNRIMSQQRFLSEQKVLRRRN
ncbi:MAG: hypothetical protein ACLP52_17205 [Streptosporangiaceae bacterium]